MPDFHSFVVFAEMRTGSNFLEANLNAFDGITCFGEAYNPHFIGYPNSKDILGLTQEMRENDPLRLLEVIQNAPGILGGFRYFNDHDPRVLEPMLDDPRCAKIILTRNPIESYVSRKIAAATGQWKLTNAKHAKSEAVRFSEGEFQDHLDAVQGFQVQLLNHLQRTGQTAFYVDYEDLQDVDVMNGLAAWLGSEARIESLDKKLKKQNPEPLENKVHNFEAMEGALARLDRFNLSRTPNFEPRRGPAVPTYIAAGPLLYMPMRSGPEEAAQNWMRGLTPDLSVEEGFTQKTIRQWKSAHTGFRSFTILRHPVARAHAAFCEKILPTGPGTFQGIRENLRKHFDMPLPQGDVDEDYGNEAHRAAYAVWLRFLRANLGGQTGLRVDAAWASQSSVLQGMAAFGTPDRVIREYEMAEALPEIAMQAGVENPPAYRDDSDPHHDAIKMIYDAEIEQMTREVYARDYEAFGFGNWA